MDRNELENINPDIFSRLPDREFTERDFEVENLPIDQREVFDHIRDIKDPEHPMTLEELKVVELSAIEVNDEANFCHVQFTPTIPNCSMATLIGLAIKVQLLRLLPARFKIDVTITPGTHNTADAINKQLADKERVTAALENTYLHTVINECLLFPEPQFVPRFIGRALEETKKADHQKVRYIQYSRQHIESYRRWRDIIYGSEKKWKSSLVFNV
ncbi:MIP18 family protein galla-2-like [Argiope bruennichi]|uniref:MIP18 family protein galla-2-like n=1 Tax=Argiope bruennichi TaxID=94029 RepID=UPI002495810A|nr:MIP18 family protein galla-2-like [Argiope bruennichi]